MALIFEVPVHVAINFCLPCIYPGTLNEEAASVDLLRGGGGGLKLE